MSCRRSLPRSVALAVVLAVVLAIAAPVAGQPKGQPQQPPPAADGQKVDPEQLLGQAEKFYEALEYEAALKALIMVHRVPGVTVMQRSRSFLYMGVCFTALGNAESAVQSFMELLKVKPGFRLPPGISPSIQAMFKEALLRLKLPATAPPEPAGGAGADGGGGAATRPSAAAVTATAPGTINVGQPVDVRIEVSDPQRQVEDVVIHWRLVGGPDYSTIRVKYQPGQKVITGRIPAAVVAGAAGRLHYLVEVMGKGGLALAHAGTMNSPLEVEVKELRQAKKRWGWYVLGIGGGAAVVGGIVAAILLTRGGSAPPPKSTADVSIVIK